MKTEAASPTTRMPPKTAAKAGLTRDAERVEAMSDAAEDMMSAAAGASVLPPAPTDADASSAVPHPTQNFPPATTGVPHCGQNRILSTCTMPGPCAGGYSLRAVGQAPGRHGRAPAPLTTPHRITAIRWCATVA